MVIKRGITKTEQVESEVYAEVGSNKVTGTFVYVDNLDGWVSRLPQAGSSHPDYPGLLLKDVRMNRLDGGQCKVLCNYESFSATASYPGRPPGQVKRYDLEVSTSEEPLLSHPKFEVLSEESKFDLMTLMNGVEDKEQRDEIIARVEDAEESEAQEALRLISSGVTSYLAPGMIWVERYSDNSVDDLDEDIGKVDSPPGSPPDSAGQNWLYLGGTARQTADGQQFEIERRWMLSGEGGWDEFLYEN